MRRVLTLLVWLSTLGLSACYASVEVPIGVGKNIYTVNARHTPLGSGLTSHIEIRELAIQRGKDFCERKSRDFRMISYSENGFPGLGAIDDTVNFACVRRHFPVSSPHPVSPERPLPEILVPEGSPKD